MLSQSAWIASAILSKSSLSIVPAKRSRVLPGTPSISGFANVCRSCCFPYTRPLLEQEQSPGLFAAGIVQAYEIDARRQCRAALVAGVPADLVETSVLELVD